MDFKTAKQQYFEELKEQCGCLTIEEVFARISKTTIGCGWVDYVNYLAEDGIITEKQRQNWGQVI